MRSLLLIALLAIAAPATANADSVTFTFEQATNAVDKEIHNEINTSDVVEQVKELVADKFAFKHPLKIIFGGEEGPLYDPTLHTVYIPYAFIDESRHYFASNNYEKDYGVSEKQAAIDTLLHTLFHEIAHAYIEDQGIAILGKEEDAADNLATLMLLEYFENGGSAAISAADMFAFESNDSPEYYEVIDYIGEHSFDLQRHFSTLCLVYGFDPETHQNLLDEVNGEDRTDRQEYCIEYFETVQRNWHQHLN